MRPACSGVPHQACVGKARSRLLGLFLVRTFARTVALAGNLNFNPEHTVVIRPGPLGYHILRIVLELPLCVLLKKRLIVFLVPVFKNLGNFGNEKPQDESASLAQSAVKKVRPDHRFHCIGKYRPFGTATREFLASANENEIINSKLARDSQQTGLTHHEALDFRKLPFCAPGKALVEILCHDYTKNRITKEFQALVVSNSAPLFVRKRAVAKRKVQEINVFEFYAGVSLKDKKLIPPNPVNDGSEMSFCSSEKSHCFQSRCKRLLTTNRLR